MPTYTAKMGCGTCGAKCYIPTAEWLRVVVSWNRGSLSPWMCMGSTCVGQDYEEKTTTIPGPIQSADSWYSCYSEVSYNTITEWVLGYDTTYMRYRDCAWYNTFDVNVGAYKRNTGRNVCTVTFSQGLWYNAIVTDTYSFPNVDCGYGANCDGTDWCWYNGWCCYDDSVGCTTCWNFDYWTVENDYFEGNASGVTINTSVALYDADPNTAGAVALASGSYLPFNLTNPTAFGSFNINVDVANMSIY